MKNPRKIHVLHKFVPFFRLLDAFNVEHFGQSHRTRVSHAVRRALGESLCILSVPVTIAIGTWHLVDCADDLQKAMVGAPLVLSMVNEFVSGILLLAKNRQIHGALADLQCFVETREHCDLEW